MIYHDISDMTEQQRLIGKRNCCRLSLRGFALNTATDSLGNELLDCTQFKFLLTSLDQLWILCFRFRRINWMNLAAKESQCHVNQSHSNCTCEGIPCAVLAHETPTSDRRNWKSLDLHLRERVLNMMWTSW